MSAIFSPQQVERTEALLTAARAHAAVFATAESCTGGLVAALLTEIAGSSAVFDRGFVTYTNAAKHELLGVPEDALARFGAVSAETAAAMARGALLRSAATHVVAITGIAGPGGGSPDKPVGLVWFGFAARNGAVRTLRCDFGAIGRAAVRAAALDQALGLFEDAVAR